MKKPITYWAVDCYPTYGRHMVVAVGRGKGDIRTYNPNIGARKISMSSVRRAIRVLEKSAEVKSE